MRSLIAIALMSFALGASADVCDLVKEESRRAMSMRLEGKDREASRKRIVDHRYSSTKKDLLDEVVDRAYSYDIPGKRFKDDEWKVLFEYELLEWSVCREATEHLRK